MYNTTTSIKKVDENFVTPKTFSLDSHQIMKRQMTAEVGCGLFSPTNGDGRLFILTSNQQFASIHQSRSTFQSKSVPELDEIVVQLFCPVFN